MPATPKSPQSKKQGAPKAKGAVRAKSGCYTCRIRRKKCDEHQNQDGHCETCVRLRLQCLGFGAKRPEWLRESRNVSEMRDKIKGFLAAQGMIKGHSGSGPRGSEHDSPILRLEEDNTPSSSESPPTPTLSLSPSEAPRSLGPHESAIREQRTSWIGVEYPHGLHMRGTSPFEGSSHSSHPDMYPNSYNSNSLVPWNLASSRSSAVERALPVERFPPMASSFSSTYHTIYDDDLYYPAPIEDESAGLSSYSIYLPLKPGGDMDDLVTHYLGSVMDLQYLLVDSRQMRNILLPSVTNPGAVQDAARLLAAVHVQHASFRSHSFVALNHKENRPRYDALMFVLQKQQYSEDDALAAISVISTFLFDGGRGAWQAWLAVSYNYVRNVFHNCDPRDKLQTCSETTRFVIKAAIWFDVLAAITTQESPRFLPYIRLLYSPEASGVYDPTLPPSPQLSMMSVMGCENHIVWALAEASELAVWKRSEQQRGCLSVPELVARATRLDKNYLNAAQPPLYGQRAPGAQTETEIARELSNNIFRAATRVYVRSIVSGDYPHVPEIMEAIEETMEYVRTPAEHSQKVYSSVVRSTVFAFFICGALTDNVHLRHEVNERLCLTGEDPSLSTVGNSASIRKLLEKIWSGRQKNAANTAVRWRDVLRDANMLLV